jgi:glycosyltransferase involved in cell wall biosynthesis
VCRQKGQDVALRAWRRVLSVVPQAVLVVIGDGPDAAHLRSVAPPNVVFLGHRSDVRQLLAACDVVALPSRWEGLSLSLLEAMACGRAVVATAVSGTASALGRASAPPCGRLVPPAEDAVLAEVLIEILTDAALARNLGAAARERVRDLFTEQATAGAVQNMTRAAMALARGRARVTTAPASRRSIGVHMKATAGRR